MFFWLAFFSVGAHGLSLSNESHRIDETINGSPCRRCGQPTVRMMVSPHPSGPGMMTHLYKCTNCNAMTKYVLPKDATVS